MSETQELAAKLAHRNAVNEGESEPQFIAKNTNVYTEFSEFSRKEIKNLEKQFRTYDIDRNNVIDLPELKYMMEKLEVPQTHLALKAMIAEVDEDYDGAISFREFLLIFRKAKAGELISDGASGLYEIYKHLSEVDVDAEGVKGAKNFFQAKIQAQTESSKFEQEIRQEQEERKKEMEEAAIRKQAFKEKAQAFGNA